MAHNKNPSTGADRPHHSKDTTPNTNGDDTLVIHVFKENANGTADCLFPRILTTAPDKRTPPPSQLTPKQPKSKLIKNQDYWKQVQQCEKLFGKSSSRPEVTDKSLRNDLWRNNFFQGYANENPYITEIENWIPDRKLLLGSDSPNPIPVHQFSELHYLDNIRQIRRVVQELNDKTHDTMAFDLEFYNRNVYGKSISSTLQMSYGIKNIVVDCLNGYSRQGIRHGLHKIFEDDNILKIGYAIRGDVKALQKDFGIFIHPVIDVQLAFFTWQRIHQIPCVVCNKVKCDQKNECKSPSMEKFIKFFYHGLEINKLPQKADWSMRPLSHDLLVYASLDTSILLKMWNHMKGTFGQSEPNFNMFTEEVVKPSKEIAKTKINWEIDNDNNTKWIKNQSITTAEAKDLENMFIARDWICRKENKDADKLLPNDKCLQLVKEIRKSNHDEYAKKLAAISSNYSKEFEITLLDVMQGKPLDVPSDMVLNRGIECSRCHNHGHTMGQCALPRFRNDDDKKKNKNRYRKKRAASARADNNN